MQTEFTEFEDLEIVAAELATIDAAPLSDEQAHRLREVIQAKLDGPDLECHTQDVVNRVVDVLQAVERQRLFGDVSREWDRRNGLADWCHHEQVPEMGLSHRISLVWSAGIGKTFIVLRMLASRAFSSMQIIGSAVRRTLERHRVSGFPAFMLLALLVCGPLAYWCQNGRSSNTVAEPVAASISQGVHIPLDREQPDDYGNADLTMVLSQIETIADHKRIVEMPSIEKPAPVPQSPPSTSSGMRARAPDSVPVKSVLVSKGGGSGVGLGVLKGDRSASARIGDVDSTFSKASKGGGAFGSIGRSAFSEKGSDR